MHKMQVPNMAENLTSDNKGRPITLSSDGMLLFGRQKLTILTYELQ